MAEEWTVVSLALQNYRVAGCSKPVGLGENIQVPKTSLSAGAYYKKLLIITRLHRITSFATDHNKLLTAL